MANRTKIHLWGDNGSTIISISLVLLVLGLLMMVEYHSYRATHTVQEQITYQVNLTPETSDSAAFVLQQEILSYPYVKHVDYISKEDAARIFTDELGEDFIGFIGYNPLYPSLMVNFKADIIPSKSSHIIDNFTTTLNKRDIVTDVVFQESVVRELTDIFSKMTWIMIVFIALLLIICTMLINSTIRIALYARQDAIYTMKLVGAKTGFITRPFISRSILFGLLGGLIAYILTIIITWIFDNQFGLNLLTSEHFPWYGIIGIVLLFVGMIISWLSTLLAIRRIVKKI